MEKAINEVFEVATLAQLKASDTVIRSEYRKQAGRELARQAKSGAQIIGTIFVSAFLDFGATKEARAAAMSAIPAIGKLQKNASDRWASFCRAAKAGKLSELIANFYGTTDAFPSEKAKKVDAPRDAGSVNELETQIVDLKLQVADVTADAATVTELHADIAELTAQRDALKAEVVELVAARAALAAALAEDIEAAEEDGFDRADMEQFVPASNEALAALAAMH